MSTLWLRTATALYACGLLYALIQLFRRQNRLFIPALTAFGAGTLLHLVSIVEWYVQTGHLPLNNFYETSSTCAFLIAVLFLIAYGVYRVSVFSVCLFPLVFFMTLIGATEFPVSPWTSPQVRDIWLLLHITTVLIGYAALILSAVASIFYLIAERRLKQKDTMTPSKGLPPLATLDRLITQAMNTGFVFITVGTVTGVVWLFVDQGTRWISDPKIGLYLFTWAFYLTMIFLRVSAGWRGRRIAWLALSVLCCTILTWAAHVGWRSL